jgi:hypothetical protein
MYWLILLILVLALLYWWLRSERALTRNEEIYLRRRGYDFEDEPAPRPALDKDRRILNLIESLEDITPYSRQRAAEEIARLCESGHKDPRLLEPLIAALDDSNAIVRSAVAAALGSLGDERAIEPLKRKAETDESFQVRAAAKSALEKLSGQAHASS